MFQAFPDDVMHLVRVIGLAAARTIPLVLLVPVLGGPAFSLALRLVLGIGLAVLCLPTLAEPPALASAWLVLALVVREIMVGLTLGFVCGCVFRAAEAAGLVIDSMGGLTSAEAASPIDGQPSGAWAGFFLILTAVIFFHMGGLGMVATSLARSYEALPLGASLASNTSGMIQLLLVASGKLIEAALGLCAPVVVAMVMVDIVLGTVARAVPSFPLAAAGAPLRALAVIGMVLLGLAGLVAAVQSALGWFMRLFAAASGWAG
jgi:flagellar biosynthetic protein FliR